MSEIDETKELMYRMVEHYFGMRKASRSLEDMIVKIEAESKESKEEKIKAIKTFFRTSKTLKQLEPEIERYAEFL